MTKKPNRRKSIPLTFYVTEQDAQTIRRKAAEADMDLTHYLTVCAVGKRIVHIDSLSEFIRELKQQGNNLNQLTTLANMGKVQAVHFQPVYDLYLSIQKTLKEILEKAPWQS